MIATFAIIGFGEAGQAFAHPGTRVFDRKTSRGPEHDAMRARYRNANVIGADTPVDAVRGVDTILSLVTADQAMAAAREHAPLLDAGALWLDMNSVAPGTKRGAAAAIEGAGGRYVDVAVMAPVLPARRAVPLLVAGPHAPYAIDRLREYGFSRIAYAGPRIGDASAIKMIRSVMVKGMEALAAECALAAHRAGVTGDVIASLDAGWRAEGWEARVDYNLDRMLAHGIRRAAEMEEVAATLEELGIEPAMTRAAIGRQRALGSLSIAPPTGLTAKLAALGDCV